jgi:hypothetical protein
MAGEFVAKGGTAVSNSSPMNGPAQLMSIADFLAAKIGESVATTADLPDAGSPTVWPGRTITVRSNKAVYVALDGDWVRMTKVQRGGFAETIIASNGSTAITHGLGVIPDYVQLSVANHSSSDANTLNWRAVIWGSPSATVFNVRLVDNRTNGYLSGSASARFSWLVGIN